ncbi:MAG: hypothetical protein IKT67_02540 [Lachnospiraceae bacterium]|nr:hypothetical protein [Lachnospiraceae bacterium]
MELLLELIVEFVAEGLFWGIDEGLESKKVPMPLRILLALILVAFVLGIGAFIIFAGMSTDSVALRILLGVVFVVFFGGLTWKLCKVFRKRRQ